MVPHSPDDTAGESYTFQYSARHDGQPLLAIVDSVAWVKGTDARELEPLHHVIDVDTLDRLLGGHRREPARTSANPAGITVTFRYEGFRLTVTPEQVTVEPE